MVHNIFMNYVLYGLSCLEYGTIYKHLLLNSVVFKVISVVAIVGSIAILLSKPHKTALQIVCTKQRVYSEWVVICLYQSCVTRNWTIHL